MMHIAAAAVVAVPVVVKINIGDTKVKITKKELGEIIREEVQNKLNEFVEFDDEGNPIGATPPGEKEEEEEEKREVDKDGVPLKAPFPPGIKTTRELIKKFPYNSPERKLFRKWYTTYGPGSKSPGSKNKRRKSPKNLSDFHPKVRAAMESADRIVAKIFKDHRNRNNAYSINRLRRSTTYEHKNLLKALKLYKKAAQAGNKRAKREIIMVQNLLKGDISSMPKGGQQPDPKPPKKAEPMSAKAAYEETLKLMRQAGMKQFLVRGTYRNNYRVFYPDEGMKKRYPKLKSSVNTSGGSNPQHRRLIILKKALGN